MDHEGHQRHLDLFELVQELTKTDRWEEIFDKVLGLNGCVSQWTHEEQKTFWGSRCHLAILNLLTQVREVQKPDKSPRTMVTVRMPRCVHERLKAEAFEKQTKLQEICLSKLLQPIDEKLVARDTPANHSTCRSQVDSTTPTALPASS